MKGQESMNKLLIIDGNSLLFRAFYATYSGDPSAIMRAPDGTPTNAIFALSNMMVKILGTLQEGDGIFVGFDSDSETFRRKEFESYKANRKPAPPELIPQFALSRELLDCLGIPHYEESGIEADDICGSLAKQAEEKLGCQIEVYTSDKDYLQLIDNKIAINLLKTGLSSMERMDEAKMKEQWGFAPRQIIDYKGLCGDSSDNLPGIRGIGDVTAKKLIAEYGDFPSIVKAAEEGRIKGKMGEKIAIGKADGEESYRLAHILLDRHLPFEMESLVYKGYDRAEVEAFSAKCGLRQLLGKLPHRFERSPAILGLFDDGEIDLKSPFSLYLDYDDLLYPTLPPKGIGIAQGGKSHYYPLEEAGKLKEALEDASLEKICCHHKQAINGLRRIGIELRGVSYDSLLSAYLLDSDSASTPEAALLSLGAPIDPERRALSIAEGTLLTKEKALEELRKNGAEGLLNDVELPLSRVLADIEEEGIACDENSLLQAGEAFKEKLREEKQAIDELSGTELNPLSPKQVAEMLFDDLGLPETKKRSTSVGALEEIKDAHPLIPHILEYRKYAKLLGTYVEGLLPHIKEGKIHTTLNQTLTSTGRLSSSSPNLQNIASRDEEGSLIKKAFAYPDGRKILSIDYSQIELRILAALSGSKAYKAAFEGDDDVHSDTARRIFKLGEGEAVPKDLRRRAKAINFAIIYGTTAFGLATQIGCTPKQASELISEFYRHYPEIDSYLHSVIEKAERDGFVSTLLGRRRYLNDVNSSNYATRETAKRAALNAPVQGSAADLIKVAMIKVGEYLKKHHCKTKMVLQIHDELLFALDKEEEATLPGILKSIMENALPLPVKIKAEIGIGNNYDEAK